MTAAALRGRSETTTGAGPVVAVLAALYVAFVVARLAAFGWDPSAFVVAGEGVTERAQAPANLGVNQAVDGYDGQAYYRLARAPLTDEVSAYGIEFRRPAYWQTRIGYPGTVWALSLGGRQALVPAMMVVVNVAAMIAIGCAAVALARDLGRGPWLALVPALAAGYVVGVAEDLTEPLAGALLIAALLALRRRRFAWAAAALTAAALTRETSLVLAVAVGVVAVLPTLRRRIGGEPGPVPPWWVAAVPLVSYAGWRTWVRSRWPDPVSDAPGDNILTAPFAGLGRYLATAAADPGGHATNLLLLALTIAAVALVAAGLVTGDGGLPHERLALAAYLLLLVCLPVWDRSQAYLRWCCEPMLLGWLVLLARPSLRLRALGATVVALWLVAALTTYRYPGPERWVPAAQPEPAVHVH